VGAEGGLFLGGLFLWPLLPHKGFAMVTFIEHGGSFSSAYNWYLLPR
jgi:hypothetical protein